MTLLLAISVVPVVAGAAVAAGGDPLQKVDPKVLAQLDKKDETTFFVLLRSKASLAGASAIRQHGQRTGFVRQRLTATADASQAGLRSLLKARHADFQSFWIVNTVEVTGGRQLVKEIASRDDVERVVPSQSFQLIEPRPGKPQAEVNGVEWNIDRIRAPEVWSTFADRGEGIVVANIDTGVQFDHPALVRQYRGNLGGGQFDHNYNWFDPAGICPNPAPCDNNSHGTHTMGTMVGDDGDPGSNQIGVAPHARWIAAKGCESRTCSDASLLAAGQWILAPTDLNGQNPRSDLAPNIVNNSWGGAGGDPFYQGIVDSWVAAGIFPAFSAGNDGPACGSANSPGDFLNTYAAGNHDINNQIDVLSSRGPSDFGGETKPNIAAPGDDVRSSVPGGGYALFSGTSMASPHVSGTVALMWSAAPTLAGDLATTRQLLDDSAIDTPDLQCGGTVDDNNVFGEGRLDAFTAVQNSPHGASGTLTGTVTDAATGQPIAGAAIHLTGPNERSTATGGDGSWSLVLTAGTYDLTVSHFGFATGTTSVEVTDGGTTTQDLALTPLEPATVSGHVRDDRGAPLAHATVTVLNTPLPPVTTDASGAYTIPDVPVGSYTVEAEAGRCLVPQQQPLVVDGDETLDFTLAGRSDGFGYTCRPSDFDFVDAGTVLNLTGDDASVAIDLPFPFTFYGTTYSTAFVSTNGFLNFTAADNTFNNTPIPTTAAPNNAIYPFWDDLFVDGPGSVRTEVVGTAPNRRLVVEWSQVRFVGDQSRITFEAVLSENGRIQFQYKDLASGARGQGASATIGIENQTGTDALQYSSGEAVLQSGDALTFRRPGTAFAQGTITDANDGQPVAGATVRALSGGSPVAESVTDATGGYRFQLALDTYAIEASAPNYETATTPVDLSQDDEVVTADVSLPTGRAEVAPATIQLVVPRDQQRQRQFTLRNTGVATLRWSVEERSGGTPQDVPWLAASPGSGTLAADGSQTVTVEVDTTGQAPGIYNATLVVRSNSGRRPEVPVAVRLIVPAYQAAVDAGATSAHTDALGDTWGPDQAFSIGSFGYLDSGRSKVVTTDHAIDGTNEDTLYQTARENAFEYRFDNLPAGTYEVDLRFAEPGKQKPNRRLFDVIVENQMVLPALDVALEVGSFHADDHVFLVRVTDGQLNVRLVLRRSFGQPFISALRVTERPDAT
jgi:subtilisin family serine protease